MFTYAPWEEKWLCRLCKGGGGWGVYATADHLNGQMHKDRSDTKKNIYNIEYYLKWSSCPILEEWDLDGLVEAC